MKREALERMRADARAMREFCLRVESWCDDELRSLERRATRVRIVPPPAEALAETPVTDLDRAKAQSILRRYGHGGS